MRYVLTLAVLLVALAVVRPEATQPVYVQVALYDIVPDMGGAFEKALVESQARLVEQRGFLEERVLRNLDPLAAQYATYTKFTETAAASDAMRNRLSVLAWLCRRAPEVHLTRMLKAYDALPETDAGATAAPAPHKGRIAHLGLFIPYPKYRGQYDQVLDEVKTFIRDRRPAGYLGEETAVEVNDSPWPQTPYSPRPRELSAMSINYGEYTSLENAENAYTNRHNRPKDPKIVVMERLFFSALQVPTRFYLFEVTDRVARFH
ncbi:MAG: hypothetical protein ACRD26_21805 [Vicinamibacterales bacterium]